jgi:hypothetical protein
MRRLGKLVNVLLVIGAAALMSVPFKRVPPQNTNKNAGRGEWQLVKPDIPFRDLLKTGEAPTGKARKGETPTGAATGKSGNTAENRSGKTVPRGAKGPSRGTRPILPDSGSGAESATGGASPAPTVPTPSVSYSRPSPPPIPVAEPLSDREAMKRARALRVPRIEPLPEPSTRLDDDSAPPSLPTEFAPL